MTREELLTLLRALAAKADRDEDDPEDDHPAADKALLTFINDPEVTAAFDAIRKWYS
jgi:hypothetical protein